MSGITILQSLQGDSKNIGINIFERLVLMTEKKINYTALSSIRQDFVMT